METDAYRDAAAEDRAGAAATPEPTPAERARLREWMAEIEAEQTPEELAEIAAQHAPACGACGAPLNLDAGDFDHDPATGRDICDACADRDAG